MADAKKMKFWQNIKTGVRLQTPEGSAVDRKAEADPGSFRQVGALVDKRTTKGDGA